MSLFSRLFGGGGPNKKPEAEPEIYEGFRIFAEPLREASGYRVSARIEKDIDGQTRSHQLIRADICESETAAREMSTQKAKAMIDQQGEAFLDA